MKNIIITGGGMGNKGAQSMTFICVEEMKKRYPKDRIVLMTLAKGDSQQYRFDVCPIAYSALQQVVRPVGSLKAFFKRIRKEEVQKITGLFEQARLMIDISGYALGSNWADATVDYYLSCIECARKYDVPVYVMPQSFGPFDYPQNASVRNRISQTMAYPRVIYAREAEGYRMMKEQFGLHNLKQSCDMVIRGTAVEPDHIYRDYVGTKLPQIVEHAVGIIPNIRNFDHGDKSAIMNFYRIIIQQLLSEGKQVYILYHSGEDAPICQEIKEAFQKNNHVTLLPQDFDCFAYEEIVGKFDYLIASRYHSIIHALRNRVPCIAMGWATKYIDLLALFEQKNCMIDVRKSVGEQEIIDMLQQMEAEYGDRGKVIQERLKELRRSNLFDEILAEVRQ